MIRNETIESKDRSCIQWSLIQQKSLKNERETNGKKDRDVRNERTNPVSKTKDTNRKKKMKDHQ